MKEWQVKTPHETAVGLFAFSLFTGANEDNGAIFDWPPAIAGKHYRSSDQKIDWGDRKFDSRHPGGGIGGQLLSMITGAAAQGGSLDLESILESIASGGVGGGVLMAIVGAIKAAMAKGNSQ